MNIYLIRHGRQSSKLCNVDVNLSEEGQRQALLVGERLISKKIEAVYSSQLIRAVETARIANQLWNTRHVIREELREISFGQMEGMTDAAIARDFSDFKAEQEKMEKDLPYPGGESASDVIERAMPILNEITSCDDYQNVAIVTHGGVIRSVISSILHMEPRYYRIFGTSLENCSITQIKWERDKGIFTLECFNDYAHLEPYPELLRASWTDAEN